MQPNCASCKSTTDCHWSSLNDKLIEELVHQSNVRSYAKKQFIFHEADAVHGLYILCEGLVKLIKTTANSRQVIVKLVYPGELLGGLFFLNGNDASFSAQAVEDSSICFTHRSYIEQMLQRDANLSLNLLTYFNEQLCNSFQTLCEFAAFDVEQRLAGTLLRFAEHYAVETRDGLACHLPLRRGELAEFLGTTAETTARTLSNLKRQQIIALERRTITFLDVDRLRAIAKRS